MNALRTLLAADLNKAVLFASCVSGRARKIVASRSSPLFAVNCALDAIEAFEATVMASAGTTPSSTDVAAAALNRRFRPWWKHPRWHVHHWQINVSLFRNLRRMVQPCATCGKPLGFGYCPHSSGGKHHHSECLGIGEVAVSDFEAGR